METVGKLMDHFSQTEKRKAKETEAKREEGAEGEGQPSPADIKKAVDDLAAKFAESLDDLDVQIAKLADSGSSQQETDTQEDQVRRPARGHPELGGSCDDPPRGTCQGHDHHARMPRRA